MKDTVVSCVCTQVQLERLETVDRELQMKDSIFSCVCVRTQVQLERLETVDREL